MKIAILDYSSSEVWLFSIPKNIDEEELDTYIEEELGFNPDNIAYMTGENIDLRAHF